MNRFLAIASVSLLATGLAACGGGQPDHAAAGASGAGPAWAASAGSRVDHALAEAQARLATKDIRLWDRDDQGKSLPPAKITPQGDLVIDGTAVALSPAQRAAVLAYRARLVAVAQQGVAIGGAGARLGISAAGDALVAIFSGASTHDVERRVNARAAGIKAATERLCNALPALRTSQQRLASEVPAFAPYAKLTEEDVTDCHTEGLRFGGSGS